MWKLNLSLRDEQINLSLQNVIRNNRWFIYIPVELYCIRNYLCLCKIVISIVDHEDVTAVLMLKTIILIGKNTTLFGTNYGVARNSTDEIRFNSFKNIPCVLIKKKHIYFLNHTENHITFEIRTVDINCILNFLE